jgi:hypothetical protein
MEIVKVDDVRLRLQQLVRTGMVEVFPTVPE